MNKTKRTPSGETLTDLILDLFRLNSLLLTAGDRLVARLGLTSARWQFWRNGRANRPQPVAWPPAIWAPIVKTCSGFQ